MLGEEIYDQKGQFMEIKMLRKKKRKRKKREWKFFL